MLSAHKYYPKRSSPNHFIKGEIVSFLFPHVYVYTYLKGVGGGLKGTEGTHAEKKMNGDRQYVCLWGPLKKKKSRTRLSSTLVF